MAVLVNRAKMSTSTTGTGTITLGSAEDGYQTFADAGVANADVVRYIIEDGSNFEIGTGTYTASGTTLSRTVSESSNSNNAINLSGSATVFIGATAEDIPSGGGGSVTAVASGSLANGDTVVLNSNGTVSAVTGSEVTGSLGSETTFLSLMTNPYRAAFDPNTNKIMVVFKEAWSTGYLQAVVGTVSGSSISFGSVATIDSTNIYQADMSYDSSQNRFLCVWTQNSNFYGRAKVLTISGTSVSQGSLYTWNSVNSTYSGCVYDVNAGKHLILYEQSYNSTKAEVVTMSGTSLSFGSQVAVASTRLFHQPQFSYDASAQKILCFYKKGYGGKANIQVATISGTSVSFGTAIDYGAGSVDPFAAGYYPTGSINVLAFKESGTSIGSFAGMTVSISGTTPTLGTAIGFSGTSPNFNTERTGVCLTYNTSSDSMILSYDIGADGSYQNLVISGATLSVDSNGEVKYEGGANFRTPQATYDTNSNKMVFVYGNVAAAYGSGRTAVVAHANTNLKNNAFLGFSDAAYSNGATATIQCVGSIDDAQSGLTTGKAYYVQVDGSLNTSPSLYIPNAVAGIALSSSSILVKG